MPYNPSDLCQICSRPLGTARVEDHHLIPKTFKGKETIPIHQMCHQKIHATLSERELVRYYHTPNRLLEHPEIVKYVAWIKNKALDFYDKNDETKSRKRKRR